MHSWLCSYIAQLVPQEIIITTVLDNEIAARTEANSAATRKWERMQK